ncbi:hypothetical protein BBD42_01040 [Paenibacillus sp. BIHB 4019]|uniref:Uncharacterized protein n=1 Tax=Paenibacillus sp. BIHB 4019 TaxID=1870819 RepID=A0A1B2DBX5_9BACL|nr:hypothetical protein BBD42_01040 [Paenibacillus sp. BIHB 4019]
MADRNNRYFCTKHGSEIKLSPTGVEFTGGSKEPLFLKLDDADRRRVGQYNPSIKELHDDLQK